MASDRPEVAAFFAKLHAGVFKPRGYTKVRRTFQKEKECYALAFQFQGSDWNSAGSSWRFYLNVGLRFLDIPVAVQTRIFPRFIHGLESVRTSLWAEPHFEITDDDQAALVGRIAAMVEDCERYFASSHEALHQRYKLKPVSFLGYLDEALMKR